MELIELFEKCLVSAYIRVENNADYAFERKGDTLYIYFEKSVDSTDWHNNLDFPAMPYKRMERDLTWYVHRGFLRVWRSLEPYVEKAAKQKDIKEIIIVGYSHGGALALLCHEYVWFNRPDLRDSLKTYAFGCPRVVWGRICKRLHKRFEGFTVIRNVNDIVTHLPPAIFGYRHVGHMIEIGKRGRYSATNAHRPENILAELKMYK